MSGTARAEILSRVGRALGDHSLLRESEYATLPRDYRRDGQSSREEVMDQLTSRLRDYDAGVYHCSSSEIAETIAVVMATRDKNELLRTESLPDEWLPPAYRFPCVNGMTYEEVDRGQGVLTGCAVAIAFTGTIILRHDVGDARRALTLIPDYHLCVVFADQVVETVPEGFDRLRGLESQPITTISGPSATADIEMNRVKGVHGPRFLDVILVS